jgi:hypothetical protein
MTGFNSKRGAAADKLQEPWNEDEWRRNNWRCQHGWLRGEQCEICNAAQPAQEPVAWIDPRTLHHLKIGLEGVHLVYETEMVNSLPLYDKPQVMTGFNSKRDAAANRDALFEKLEVAQPAQEPVAWPCLIAEADFSQDTVTLTMQCDDYKVSAHKHWLSTTPPKREWVGLTDDELADLWYKESLDWMEFARAVIAKLQEKNT